MKAWNKWITNFFDTNWVFVTFIGFIAFFSFIQLFMFGLIDDFFVYWLFGNPITHTSSNAWLGWLLINLAFLGSCITIGGELILVRGKKKFLFPVLVGQIMLIFYGVLSGLWFLVIDYIFYCIVGILHYKFWTDEDKKENVMTSMSYLFIITFSCVYLSISLSLTMTGTLGDLKPILDPLISMLVIFGWFNITRKNRWGYVAFLITDVLGIIMFVKIGAWGMASSYIIYPFFDISGFTIWTGWGYQKIDLEKITDHYYDKYWQQSEINS